MKVDRSRGVFDDEALEAEGCAVDGGVADAVVVGKTREEEPFEAAFAKVACETRWGDVIVLKKCRVAIDISAESFAEDEFGVRDIEAGMEVGAASALNAVIGPEGLGAVLDFDAREGLRARVG